MPRRLLGVLPAGRRGPEPRSEVACPGRAAVYACVGGTQRWQWRGCFSPGNRGGWNPGGADCGGGSWLGSCPRGAVRRGEWCRETAGPPRAAACEPRAAGASAQPPARRRVELVTIMLSASPLESLKLHVSSRPPLVVFMISVSAMAIAFLTLGYFFKIKEIKSPEMAEDWNTFLLRFNDLDLCVSENETLKHLSNDTSTPESTMTSGQSKVSTQSPQTLEDSGPVNISVAITLTLDPLKPFGGYSRNVTHLYSTILGHQIGLSGREAHEEINITFTLPAAWSSDDCALHGHCEQVVFTACMTLTATPGVFPVTVQPPHCVPDTYSNATLWYKIFTTARDANTKYAQDYNPFWCYKGAIGKVYHALNPKLTVIVPDDDRSLINLHLMHTSYFLFVMVITMFCYAVIKGRPSKLRQSNPEFCSEKVALAEA
ncbi:transmembrane protein 248 [Marmota monax]|uniref:Transmembrane protein 248 n=1 Tax=Marmota monax TaxID=9995 RepID=A0A834UPX6_MARMO|nr:transmembrane protein 248 [Marmota monax]